MFPDINIVFNFTNDFLKSKQGLATWLSWKTSNISIYSGFFLSGCQTSISTSPNFTWELKIWLQWTAF